MKTVGTTKIERRSRSGPSTFFNREVLAAALVLLTAASTTTSVAAFSPELLNQVIVQLQSDELLFVAANLLDNGSASMRSSQHKIMSQLSSSRAKRRGGGSMLKFPKILEESVYDYESTTATADGAAGYGYYGGKPAALRPASAISGRLDLTPAEDELIRLVARVRDRYSPRTTVRIAGGWVRDKLLYGKDTPSRDIDFVVSDTSGREFADQVCRYLDNDNVCHSDDEADGDGAAAPNKNVCTIEILPTGSKSKGEHANHLETASLTTSSGFELDFCRLRFEKYDKDSRIPTNIGVASAVEDAWRRDLTINSLYYNINTNQVEDWTERGIPDLISQTVATPRKPLATLLEDPTRILRAVRFAAQLSFQMSPALMKAARDDRVKYALHYKVSRDAIGGAVDEMFGTRARDPVRGIKLLMATDLIDVVFPLQEQRRDDADASSGVKMPTPTSSSSELYQAGLETISRTQSLVTRIFLNSPKSEWDISKRRFLWYAAFFKPIHDIDSATPSSSATCSSAVNNNSKKRRRQESVFYQLLDAMRRPKDDMTSIENILKGVDAFDLDKLQSAIHDLSPLSSEDDAEPSQSKEILSDIRWTIYTSLKPIGSMWKEALILALASSPKSLPDCVAQYNEFTYLIEDTLQLRTIVQDKNSFKPLLNGSQIQQAFVGKIDGKSFRVVVQAIEEWQIRNSCFDLGAMDDEERHRMEERLVDFLFVAFPEYANGTATTC